MIVDGEQRHELMNGILLCAKCHIPFAHAYPDEFLAFLERYRQAWYAFYEAHRWARPRRISVIELNETGERLRLQLEQIRQSHVNAGCCKSF